MKKLITFSIACLLAFSMAQANELSNEILKSTVFSLKTHTDNVINWKVGDTMDYNISIGAFGQIGTTTKTVTKDEGVAIWLNNTMSYSGVQDVSEILINKADGKILKLIHNGKEQSVPNQDIEIISMDQDTVTVPAGTFDVVHVVAKTKEINILEILSNPVKSVMDGAVKQLIASQFGDIILELTAFKHGV
ncbi:MAG: hypothetical protein HY843_03460 [Bdellovibrio sp.]|nr:hypothetical protein [Bdellovibrio sp.]